MSGPSRPPPDEREVRICEASLAITQTMIKFSHISEDEFLMAILRIAPRLVKRPRRKKAGPL